MIFISIFHRRHTSMLLEISAKERRVWEIQVVGNLLYRHVGKTQSVLNGFHREKLYDGTRPADHRLFQNGLEIFGRDVELAGKFLHSADTSIALFCHAHKLVGQSSAVDAGRSALLKILLYTIGT